MDQMRPQELISNALDVLAGGRKWTRGHQFHNVGGVVKHCALGALAAAYHHNEYRHVFTDVVKEDSPLGLAVQLLAQHIPVDFQREFNLADVGYRIALYNNSRSDFTEIEQWFQKAAADERVDIC